MPLRAIQYVAIGLLLMPIAYLVWLAIPPSVPEVLFWNGHKPTLRQTYDSAVLQAALKAADGNRFVLAEDREKLARLADEARLFRHYRRHVFAAREDNPRLMYDRENQVKVPILQGIDGSRLLLVRAADVAQYQDVQQLSDLNQQVMGMVEAHDEAAVYQSQGISVVVAPLSTLLAQLAQGELNFIGVELESIDEVWSQVKEQALPFEVAPKLLLQYPSRWLFYVNPVKRELKDQLQQGLLVLEERGELKAMFDHYYGELLTRWQVGVRQRLLLDETTR